MNRTPLASDAFRSRRYRQLVQVVHRRTAAPAKYVHAVAVHDAHMRIAGDGRRSFAVQNRPQPSIEVEHMRVAKVSRTVVATVEDHQVLVNDACGYRIFRTKKEQCCETLRLGGHRCEVAEQVTAAPANVLTYLDIALWDVSQRRGLGSTWRS